MFDFDTIVRVLDRGVRRVRNEFIDGLGQRRGPIGDHLALLSVVTDRSGEEPARGDGFATLRDEHVDDLAVVIGGAVDVTPTRRTPSRWFVDEPAVTDRILPRVGCVDQDRGEVLNPPEQGDVFNSDAALSEEFFEITVGQSVAQVPAHSEHDHLRHKPEPHERRQPRLRWWNSMTSANRASLVEVVPSGYATEPTHVLAPMKPHPPMWLISTLAGRVAGRMVIPAVNPSVNDDLVSE